MRITITIQESGIAPETASMFAAKSIEYWRRRKELWSPGAIIVFDEGVVTSTRQTSAGWTVNVTKEKF